ncbi:MAG: hypothetical protein JW829_16725 [Pirellulales bacterium]|nr:hypothetical protein [Pirellulales bacterium]
MIRDVSPATLYGGNDQAMLGSPVDLVGFGTYGYPSIGEIVIIPGKGDGYGEQPVTVAENQPEQVQGQKEPEAFIAGDGEKTEDGQAQREGGHASDGLRRRIADAG